MSDDDQAVRDRHARWFGPNLTAEEDARALDFWRSVEDAEGVAKLRTTWTVTDLDGQPLHRDEYAAVLEEKFEEVGSGRMVELTEGQALVIADLLDELMGACQPSEPFGRLARRAAVLLYDKAGI